MTPLFTTFSGDRKSGKSLLHFVERPLRDAMIPFVPSWMQTHHLTLMTVSWSGLCVFFGYLAQENLAWLWAMSGAVAGQYVTDLLDGEIGRRRNTGLVKWGYFMDHFLDYVFLCGLMIGYAFLIPHSALIVHLALLGVFGGYMTHSFLAFAATDRFQISYLGVGPTEIRLLFILANAGLFFFGTTPLPMIEIWLLIASAIGLIVTVWRTQKTIWAADMSAKR